MKDTEITKQVTAMEDAERFQASFFAQQADIEQQLAACDAVQQGDLQQHFAQISLAMQDLQKLYSTSAPYIRIYDRKRAQDNLHALQTSFQEVQTRLVPRKKFVFKGKKDKGKEVPCIKNGSEMKEAAVAPLAIDYVDGPGTSVLRNHVGETIVLKTEEVTGKAFLLSHLQDCSVQILGAPSTVHVANVSNCSIFCGPVATSVFVEGASNSNFQLACQQLRIHDATDTQFRIHVTSKAIIENSRTLRFGMYSFKYSTIDDDFKTAGLRRDVNNWWDVDDFNWLVVGQQSPNWSLLDATDS